MLRVAMAVFPSFFLHYGGRRALRSSDTRRSPVMTTVWSRHRCGAHAGACIIPSEGPLMRTTIEMKPEHRAKLLELAARRGAKGFSQLVTEALDAYLRVEVDREAQRKRTARLKGALPSRD